MLDIYTGLNKSLDRREMKSKNSNHIIIVGHQYNSDPAS
jgi:hypothetical protein